MWVGPRCEEVQLFYEITKMQQVFYDITKCNMFDLSQLISLRCVGIFHLKPVLLLTYKSLDSLTEVFMMRLMQGECPQLTSADHHIPAAL